MAKDEETGVEPKATNGEPHEGGEKGVHDLEAAHQRREDASGGSMAERGAAAGEDDDEDGPDEQRELPLDIPGAKKPSLSMSSRGKPVSVEGKMRARSFRMTGVIDDPDKLIEARVLIRFEKDERVPIREGTGETAATSAFVLRQHFHVLRMDILEAQQPATGTEG